MTPSELLDDHARRPRLLGKLLNASAVGDVGSIVAGDALRFYLKIEGEAGAERIAGARFQVFNCQSQIGPASVLAELVVGMPLAQAEELGPAEVCAHLGGLPHLELPPRLWGIEGLKAAIATWRGTECAGDIDLELPQLCRCLGIPEETVRQAIGIRALADVEQVVAATGAGSVCGSCRIDIPALLDRSGQKAPAAPVPAGPTRIQLLMRIQRCAEETVSPRLRAQGGELELWDLQGTRILVRPRGTLVEDAQARQQALVLLEAALRSGVDPALVVSEQAEHR